jgi:hypothetical protein
MKIKNMSEVKSADAQSVKSGAADSLKCGKKHKRSSSSKCRFKVQATANTSRRVWDKKQYCPYCCEGFAKLPRHLESMHCEELDVIQACRFPRKSKERMRLLAVIRNKGNYQHNMSVMKSGSGILVPSKRPKTQIDASRYAVCKSCLALISRSDFWKHARKCEAGKPKEGKRNRSIPCGRLMMTADCPALSHGLRENVLSKMNADRIALIAKNDSLILQYGENLYVKHGHEPHLHNFISTKMREAARLLHSCRNVDSRITNLKDCLLPQNFPSVITAIRQAAKFDAGTNTFGTPSLALKMQYILKRCCEIVDSDAIVNDDKETRTHMKNFLRLCSSGFKCKISLKAVGTLQKLRYNKTQLLPLAGDLQRLSTFLSEKQEELQAALSAKPTVHTFSELSKVVLVQLILFNKRRAGEVQRLLLTDYEKIDDNPVQDCILSNLTPVEQELVKSMKRLELKGKRGNKVALLINHDTRSARDLLMSVRRQFRIGDDNPYVFPAMDTECKPMNACRCMHRFAVECGAEKPELITSTALRKHIATMPQLLNLNKNELDCLAKFLGHSITVHREFYRLPENTVQLAKVSKLLMSANSSKFKQQYTSLADPQQDLQPRSNEGELCTSHVMNFHALYCIFLVC